MDKLKKISGLAVLMVFLISLIPLALAAPQEKPWQRAKEGLEKAGERYQAAKEEYKEIKGKYLETKEKVQELRKEIKACKEGEEGECKIKKKLFREQTKEQLLHFADLILNSLEKLKQKIEAAEMEEEEKTELLEDIEARITAVGEARATLEGLSGESSQEEIKEAIKTIREAWKESKPKMKLGVGKLMEAKLGNIIVQIERLEEKFEKIRERLAEKGYDVTALDNYLEDLNEKLTSAKENWELAKAKFKEARTAEDVDKVIKEAHEYQKKAREYIKGAREDLRKLVQEVKGQGKAKEAGAAEVKEEEKVEETENETEEEAAGSEETTEPSTEAGNETEE